VSTVAGLVCGICFLGSFVSVGYAQEATPATAAQTRKTIESWLANGNPRLVAWAARATVVSNDRTLAPDLIEALDRWQPLPPWDPDSGEQIALTTDQLDQRDATAAVLDALIEMDVHVPADTLRNIASDFPNYTAILLSRLPLEESQPLSLDLFRSPPPGGSGLQYVSAALLAQDPPPGFAAALLSSIHVTADVDVVDPSTGKFGVGRSAGSCIGEGSRLPRKDWPVFGVYTLSLKQQAGSFLVVSDPDPLYATPSESTRYPTSLCGRTIGLSPDQRRSLIAHMLDIQADTIGWSAEPSENIEFKSEPQFYADLRAFIATEQAKYRATAAALVADNLMTQSEAQDAVPELNLFLSDMRRNPARTPIAKPSLPSHVAWFSF
jgi:hypothetical protein